MINTLTAHNHDQHCCPAESCIQRNAAGRIDRDWTPFVKHRRPARCMLINLRVWLAARRADRPRRRAFSSLDGIGRLTFTARFALGRLHHWTSSLLAARGGNLTFCGSRLLLEKQSRQRRPPAVAIFYSPTCGAVFLCVNVRTRKDWKNGRRDVTIEWSEHHALLLQSGTYRFFNRQTTFMLASQLMGSGCLCGVCVRTRSFSSGFSDDVWCGVGSLLNRSGGCGDMAGDLLAFSGCPVPWRSVTGSDKTLTDAAY